MAVIIGNIFRKINCKLISKLQIHLMIRVLFISIDRVLFFYNLIANQLFQIFCQFRH
jgi:hypothetical protein